MENSSPTAEPHPSTPSPSARRPKRLNPKVLKLIRRIHLYLGMVLVPWVLLYGVTALLFNHGSWFTERDYVAVEAVPMTGLPTPDALAQKAVADLKVEGLEWVPGTARWLGHMSLRGKNSTHRARLSLDPDGEGGLLRLNPVAGSGPKWSDGLANWKPIPAQVEADLKTAALSAANAQGADLDALKIRSYPSVRFQVKDQGVLRTVELETDGSMEVTEGDGVAPLRNRLMRLHVSHHRPGYLGARWLWALMVDIMASAMILWGFTGLLMWWTIRPTRRTGAVALGIGVSVISVLAMLLWGAFGMA